MLHHTTKLLFLKCKLFFNEMNFLKNKKINNTNLIINFTEQSVSINVVFVEQTST